MPSLRTTLDWRYALFFFLIGGVIFTLGDFLQTYLSCGQYWFYEKQCATPRANLERRGVSHHGLDIPLAHDGTTLFTFPVQYNSDYAKEAGVVLVPVAQDLDANDDGVPDQPVVWEPTLPDFISGIEDKPTNSVTPAAGEMDAARPPKRTKRGRPSAAALEELAQVSATPTQKHECYEAEMMACS
ncbi:hypothetical protein P171DRAFT_481959 [Karstenula rhodostoma CBS 690.94]|uniref:Uncharacterized protein n=1 Tax=Karstenula rhodostoma CBS 690.94 TaxID=1392251 RepID=A0A9P4PR72_9PLEO|nr:hypothetical protein P171DRAFT_481959 [Karstenula rhodostoma CBS 690.94]